MAQQVEAWGNILEFPDGMSDEDMASAIKKNETHLNPNASTLTKVKAHASDAIDAGLSALTPKKSIAARAEEQSASLADTAAPQVSGVPVRRDYYNKVVAETPKGATVPDTGIVSRVKNAATADARAQSGKKAVANALVSTEPVPEEGGFLNSAARAAGQTIKGAGQLAADFAGADQNNAVKQYGQAVMDANPTAVNSLEDIAAKPDTAFAEATGNAAPSMAGMVGARAVGQGITALSPLAGPAAPLIAAAGQVVSWLGPAAIASLPSYGGIRDKQILNDPKNEKDAKAIAIATMGAAAVGAIEQAFGPQQWALAAMTKEGRAKLAEKFAATTLPGAMAKGATKGAAIEGAEELAQNPIEQLAAGDDPTTPESVKDTLFGGAMGAIGGLGMGAGAPMIAGKPAAQHTDMVLRYAAENGSTRTRKAAKEELERRKKRAVDAEIVDEQPPSTSEAVDSILAIGSDKAKEIVDTAPDALKSDVLEGEPIEEPTPPTTNEPEPEPEPEKPSKPLTEKQVAHRERLRKQAHERRMLDPGSDTLNQAIIKLGGIHESLRRDLTGDTTGNQSIPFVGHLFSKKGTQDLSDLANRLGAHGYFTPDELNDVDGGAALLAERLHAEFNGAEPHLSMHADHEAAYQKEIDDYNFQLEQQAQHEANNRNVPFDSIAKPEDLQLHGEEPTGKNLVDAELLAKAIAIDPVYVRELASDVDPEGRMTDEFISALEKLVNESENEIVERHEDSDTDFEANATVEKNPSVEDAFGPGFDLKQQTEKDLKAASEKEKAAQKKKDSEKKKADEAERKAKEQEEIKQRGKTAADDFVLGGNALDELAGQKDIFSQPAQKPETKSEAKKEVPFSRAEPLDVQSVVNTVTSAWKNPPKIVIVKNMDDPKIPKAARDENRRQLSKGAKGKPEGFLHKGTVYIVASEMKSEKDVIRALSHESFGHFGLRGLFRHELKGILKQIAATRSADMKRKAKQYGLDLSKEKDELIAAEEVLAELAQTNPKLGFVRRAIAAIRAWFRKHFAKDMNLSNDEIIHQFIIPAREFVQNGAKAEVKGTSAFSRQSLINTAAFRKWFGDSKVVDAKGDPLVVYHGTHADFSEFDINLSPEGGFFTSADPDHAEFFGNKLMPLYLSIQNPLVVEGETLPVDHSLEEIESLLSKAKEQGKDGVIIKNFRDQTEDKKADTYVAFKPTQIKSATGNNGEFDTNNSDIRFARGPGSTFDSPEPSKLDNLIHSLQDKHIDLKRVTEAIRSAGTSIADQVNAYLHEELFHGRAATRTKEFVTNELDPLIKLMRVNGVKMADFEEYLWARHAEERNIQIAKVNPAMPDGGSGMSTKDARAYVAKLDPKKRATYDMLAKRVDAINAKSRQVLVDYGLESQKTINTWAATYKHYVPLMREDMDHAFGNGTGPGISIKGNASKRATGSKRPVVDILANMAQQREKNIIRGEKNRVATALIGLAKLNPHPDFWKVDKPPTIRTVNKVTGLVENRIDPNYKNRDNVIVARIPDKNGNIQERSVVFEEHDPRALRMSQSLKNLDQDQLNAVLDASSIITRYFSSINTQFNPIFGIINFMRDIQGAALNLTSTPLAGKERAVLSRAGPALFAIYQSTRAARSGKTVNSPMAQRWEEFKKEGGPTGFRDMYKNARDRAEALEKGLDPEWWQKTKLGKAITAGGLLNFPERLIADKAVKPLFNWLSDYNESMENAVRLAAYVTAIEQGMSKPQGASLAKNLTVNFNRKGSIGRQMGALYAFFNASVQGTARLAETMKGPAGRQILAGGIILGGMQAMLLSMSGMGDDEPPEFVKAKNLIIPIGDGKYISIPMPLGFNVLPNIGRITSEFALSGFKDPAKQTIKLFDSILDAFNPIGNAGMSLQTIAPTAIDPLAALAENKDWTGKPITKQDFNALNPSPGFTRAKDTASAAGRFLSEGLNSITGGTKYQPGAVSPTPDQIDYLISQATGGVGREYLKAEQTIKSAITGEEIPPHKKVLVGRFYGDTKGQSSQDAAFYDAIKKLNGIEAEIKGRMKNKEDVDSFKQEHPEWKLIGAANTTEKLVREMRSRKQKLEESDKPNKDELKKKLDEKRKEIMTNFNERYKEAVATD